MITKYQAFVLFYLSVQVSVQASSYNYYIKIIKQLSYSRVENTITILKTILNKLA